MYYVKIIQTSFDKFNLIPGQISTIKTFEFNLFN